MGPTSRRLAPIAAGLFLAACAYRVSIRHFVSPDRLPPQEAARVFRIFLALQARPADNGDESALDKILGVLSAFSGPSDANLSRPLTRLELTEFAGRASRALTGPAASVVSYQVVYSSAPPAWLGDFRPTGSLWLQPSDIRLSQEAGTETVKTKEGEKTETRYHIQGNFSMDWRFYAEPGHALLAEGSFPGAAIDDDRGEEKVKDLEAYLEPKLWDMLGAAVVPLRDALLPHGVERTRTIGRGKKGRLREAYRLVKGGDWDSAARLWRGEASADPGGWEARYDLGVYDERLGRWAEARREYQAALERAPRGKARRCREILDELSRMVEPPQAAAAASTAAFYQAPLAVLPFANESVDLGAQDYLRRRVFETLVRRGYNALPMAAVDDGLLKYGIREGGQLDSLPSKRMAKALKADRLLYGTVEEFKVVNVGIYFKRQVRLRLRLVDREGRTLWRNTAQTVVQSGVRPKEIASSFLSHLASTAIEKATRTYLKEESDETVRRALETLPRPAS